MATGFPVRVGHQRDVQVYMFTLHATELLELARVERYGEVADGVNRKYDESHAIEIAEAMTQPDTVMLDSICGDLKGVWNVCDGMLIPERGAYISIDDGQHRLGACMVLNKEELARWEFPVVATQGLSYEQRLKIFRQQRNRKPIDSRLDLAQRYRLDDWRTDAERAAYDLLIQLASDASSPLRGLVVLEETVKRPYEHRNRVLGINAAGLHRSLTSIMGKGSPLFALSLEKRAEVARNMIFVASEVWPRAWRSKDHVLTTARGINAVIMLIVSGKHFRGQLGNNFQIANLRAALELAGHFNWTVRTNKNSNRTELTMKLDDSIGRALTRKLDQQAADPNEITA